MVKDPEIFKALRQTFREEAGQTPAPGAAPAPVGKKSAAPSAKFLLIGAGGLLLSAGLLYALTQQSLFPPASSPSAPAQPVIAAKPPVMLVQDGKTVQSVATTPPVNAPAQEAPAKTAAAPVPAVPPPAPGATPAIAKQTAFGAASPALPPQPSASVQAEMKAIKNEITERLTSLDTKPLPAPKEQTSPPQASAPVFTPAAAPPPVKKSTITVGEAKQGKRFEENAELQNINRLLAEGQTQAALTKANAAYLSVFNKPETPDNLFIALKALDYRGEAQYRLKNFEGAITDATEAHKVAGRVYGKNAIETAARSEILAKYWEERGDIAQSLAIRDQAYRDFLLSADYPPEKLALKFNNLGEAYREMREFEKAEAALGYAVSVLEKNYGSDYAQLAIPLNNLALACKQTGKLTQSEAYLRRALQIAYKHGGKDDPSAYRIYNNLYVLLKAAGRVTEAEKAKFEETTPGVSRTVQSAPLAPLSPAAPNAPESPEDRTR